MYRNIAIWKGDTKNGADIEELPGPAWLWGKSCLPGEWENDKTNYVRLGFEVSSLYSKTSLKKGYRLINWNANSAQTLSEFSKVDFESGELRCE